MTATTYPKPTQRRWNADQFSKPLAGGDRAPEPAAITGTTIDAISIPAAFAALVRAELDIMMLAGPVVAGDDGLWTFLTQRTDTPHPTVPTDLLPLGVRTVPAGTPLAAADRPDRPPAIWSTVIGAARRVAYRTRRVA
jgi:hypothetical protein